MRGKKKSQAATSFHLKSIPEKPKQSGNSGIPERLPGWKKEEQEEIVVGIKILLSSTYGSTYTTLGIFPGL